MVAYPGQNITKDKRTFRSEKVNIQQRNSSFEAAYYLSITIMPDLSFYTRLKSARFFRIPFPVRLK
jgi:hypothetical protein